MKNRKYIIIGVFLLIFIIGFVKTYNYLRIKYAKVEVKLVDNLDIEVYSSIRVKDLIKDINGNIINNKYINTDKIGKKKITFKYINDDNIKVKYSFDINVVDTTKPIIREISYYTVDVGSDDDIASSILCGDNYDDKPECFIEGDYDINIVGEYPVKFVGRDSSGNINENNMTIRVVESRKYKSGGSSVITGTDISYYIDNYKNEDNMIGIDVSKWQGNIDYQKVKDSGVEFAIIRVGYEKGINGEFVLDPYFKDNIEGFNKVGIPVGVYFFSYANNKKTAVNQAKWIRKQIKKYKVDLPVVFDWENWDNYQEFGISFKHLTDVANSFMKEIKHYKYTPMLYGSKNYLEDIWNGSLYPVWLAHYAENTDYSKRFEIWQITDKGLVNGINNNVDIDIMYKK